MKKIIIFTKNNINHEAVKLPNVGGARGFAILLVIFLLTIIFMTFIRGSHRKKRLAVFCSNSDTIPKYYFDKVEKLISQLDPTKIEILYGAGQGLMQLTNAVFTKNGGTTFRLNYVGFLELGQHQQPSEFLYNSLSKRTEKLLDMSDEYLFLPGGVGTAWEFFEALTKNNLNISNKKIYVLNVAGFFNPFLEYLARIQKENFFNKNPQNLRIFVSESPEEIANKINNTT